MPDDIQSVYDKLAVVTAELDQVQADIDKVRSLFPSNQPIHLSLDQTQALVNERRETVRQLRKLNDALYRIQNR